MAKELKQLAQSFTVLAGEISIFSRKENKSIRMEKNQKGNVEDFDNGDIRYLSNNGKKGTMRDGTVGWVYKPSIELDGAAPESDTVNVSPELVTTAEEFKAAKTAEKAEKARQKADAGKAE